MGKFKEQDMIIRYEKDERFINEEIIQKENKTLGTKHDKGKPMLSIIPPDALLEIGKVFEFGARKYGKHNWKNGIDFSRLQDASARHGAKFLSLMHSDLDEESGIHNLAHKIVNDMMTLQFILEGRTDLDDRK